MVRNIYSDVISYLVELPTEDSEYHLQLIRIQIGTQSFYSAQSLLLVTKTLQGNR